MKHERKHASSVSQFNPLIYFQFIQLLLCIWYKIGSQSSIHFTMLRCLQKNCTVLRSNQSECQTYAGNLVYHKRYSIHIVKFSKSVSCGSWLYSLNKPGWGWSQRWQIRLDTWTAVRDPTEANSTGNDQVQVNIHLLQ